MLHIFNQFQLDQQRGFLPSEDPISVLPEYYAPWDRLGENLPALLLAGILREKVSLLPQLSAQHLTTTPELERAMLLLSFISHAYLRGQSPEMVSLPAQLARPWYEVALRLGRPPILAHASAVQHNWKRIDPAKPIGLDNLQLMQPYQGDPDEAWFFLVTVAIEYHGGKVVRGLVHLCHDSSQSAAVELILEGLNEMTGTLRRMPEKCDPYLFYHRLRPFLASFENVTFEGVEVPPLSLPGGSAAQSSLVQAIDAALGVVHPEESSSKFLLYMRDFMPPPHRAFLEYLEENRPLQKLSVAPDQKSKYLIEIKERLKEFRTAHLKIFHRYVSAQQKRSALGDTGTGGTPAHAFLKQTLADTKNFNDFK